LTKRPPHDALRQPGLGTFVIPIELLQKTIPRELTQNTNSLDLERAAGCDAGIFVFDFARGGG
jgi:hypothetical protein